jgi:WhiB family transcriptional regulator, redox-sensing transcriptional regulator
MMETHHVSDLADFLRLLGRPKWYSEAACRGMDTDLFFPRRGEPAEPAKAVCRSCPVREPCAELAADLHLGGEPVHGIWGATSARDRKRAKSAKRDVA